MNKMTKEKAGASFAAGIDCSQVVFGHVAESIGLNAGDAKKSPLPLAAVCGLGRPADA
ncbi:hypothetical protein RVY71_07400 [Emergencia timonensis]|uniref:hypothetical protein n=1 Tax=Emergencia timonensis TaxID=1776384 RepID=UPI00295AC8FE|nr:hypothetical protein [Emergencia timonensis]WNX90095.1 hypothetical protein RVY71_07400 [Emergencia timonensis]